MALPEDRRLHLQHEGNACVACGADISPQPSGLRRDITDCTGYWMTSDRRCRRKGEFPPCEDCRERNLKDCRVMPWRK